MLCPTPPERLCDANGRPYFLWDVDLTLEELRARLEGQDEDERAYWLGKVMRQAKPDDALTLVSPGRMRAEWAHVERYLGQSRAFWRWLLLDGPGLSVG